MLRTLLVTGALWLGLCVVTSSSLALGEPVDSTTVGAKDGQHDFDFYVGKWKIHNRRLKEVLSGSNQWVEFEATSVAHPIWNGHGNMDEYEADAPTGHIEGLTVRLYNPNTRKWSLYWANASTGEFALSPVVGEFKNGRGEFLDHEDYKGRPIMVRYVWSDITAHSCRWEQAFSTDEGKTWETNWIMESTREK
jgi:hypothetical protein